MEVDFSLSAYRIFNAVAKTENISLAAKELYISQPAISKAIAKLEQNMSVPLFTRNSRGVKLTEEGKQLYSYTKVAFNTLKEGLRGDSLINEKGNNFIDTDRLWWPQAEAVIGLYYFYQKTNEEKYTNKALEVFEFIEKNIVDKRRNSCWLWGVKEDLTPVKRGIAEIWKTPYHVVRMCLEILERIENDSREIL